MVLIVSYINSSRYLLRKLIRKRVTVISISIV